VKQVPVAWAREGSGFTLLFEALVMTLVQAMPVAATARSVGEHDTRIWRILHHFVCDMAMDSNGAPFVKFTQTLRDHAAGVLRWFVKDPTNGILEGINSLIQAAKAKARGYRAARNIIAMAYLIAGKLRFDGLEPLWGAPLGSTPLSPT
jgi:hypothetical protein